VISWSVGTFAPGFIVPKFMVFALTPMKHVLGTLTVAMVLVAIAVAPPPLQLYPYTIFWV